MPKLFYTPTSCGAASYIAKTIGKVPVETESVDLRSHKTKSGADYYGINVKGNVPALVLEDGTVLNEGAAVLQWIADQAGPASGLAPANGTTARYLLQNHLNYIASEVHATYGPLFNPTLTEEAKTAQKAKLATKLDYITKHMLSSGKKFLLSDELDVASIYLYIVLSWSGYLGIDLSAYPAIQAFSAAVAAVPAVKQAHEEMNAAA